MLTGKIKRNVGFINKDFKILNTILHYCITCVHSVTNIGGCLCGVMVIALDCKIIVSEFEFQSLYLRSLSDKYT